MTSSSLPDFLLAIDLGGSISEIAERATALKYLSEFVRRYESTGVKVDAENFTHMHIDKLIWIVDNCLDEHNDILRFTLKVLKILARCEEFRRKLSSQHLRAILGVLSRVAALDIGVEAANTILNACHQPQLVAAVVDLNGARVLVASLAHGEARLQSSAAGALQSLTFQVKGRMAAEEANAIPVLVSHLFTTDATFLQRVVGVLHNMSAHPPAARAILRGGATARLVAILEDPQGSISARGSAAGVLQNIARDEAGREALRQHNAAPPLLVLMQCSDLAAQVNAIGALANLTAPEYPLFENEKSPVVDLLGTALSLAIVYNCLFGFNPPVTS